MKTIRVQESQLEAMKKLGIQYEEAEDAVRGVWEPTNQGAYSLLGSGEVGSFCRTKEYIAAGNSYSSKTLASKDTDLFQRQMLIRAYDREFGNPGEERRWSIYYTPSAHLPLARWVRKATHETRKSIQDPQVRLLGPTASKSLVNDLRIGHVVLPGLEDLRGK